MRKVKIIGITGQSGSGKSTLSSLFEKKGAAVINADLLVRELYKPGSICVKILSSVFGEKILDENGEINRRELGKIAFASKENTKFLNSLVHPFVTSLFIEKIKKAKSSGKNLIIYDAPQLFESGFDVLCDVVISVVSEDEIRRKRICERDNISETLAQKRFIVQYGEEFFRENSDYIIENNGDLNAFLKAAEEIINGVI